MFVAASPGRHRLLQHKQQTADVTSGKNVTDLIQGNEQALLLVHLVLSVVLETRCSRTAELQERDVVERHHA